MAVITNGLLIGFSGRVFETLNITDVVVILSFFILFEHVILFAKFLIGVFVPDSPKHVRVKVGKQRYLKEHLIDFEEDKLVNQK
jgi:hypothetical protein